MVTSTLSAPAANAERLRQAEMTEVLRAAFAADQEAPRRLTGGERTRKDDFPVPGSVTP
jgi:hypothetical protein